MSISALFAGTSRVFYVLIVFRVRNWARILVLIADWQKSNWIQCKNMVEPNSHSDYSNREHLTYNVITKPSVQFHVLRKMKQQCCKRQHSALWHYITFLSSFILFLFLFCSFYISTLLFHRAMQALFDIMCEEKWREKQNLKQSSSGSRHPNWMRRGITQITHQHE